MFFTPGFGPMDILFAINVVLIILAWCGGFAYGRMKGRKEGRKEGYLKGRRAGQRKAKARISR